MKRSWIKLASLVILLFLVSVFLCEKTWAGGTSQTGGSSSGSGSVDHCSESYTTIHEPSCGAGGGGKSWRVYKINNNTTYGNLDNGATWEIDEGEYGGNKISGTNGIVSQCVRMKAPYILLFGLNRVAVSSSTTKKFYVTFKRSKTDTCDLKDKCRCNRGCYYDWNNYDAITAVKGLTGNFKNGRAVTNDVAKELYKKEFGNLTNYSEKGAFCTWADIVTLTGKSVDIWGNSLASYSGLGDKTQSVTSGSVATVTRGTNAVYTYKGWETSLNGTYTQSGHGTTYYSQTMNGNGVVYFVYEPPKYTLTGTAIDINGNSLSGVTGLENVSQTVYSGQTAEVERRTTEAGYTYKGWELTKDGSYRNADHKNTKYSQKMTGNTTMYFVYEPFRQTSELEIKVKNNSVTSQGNYAKEVYAKPGDKMTFWTSYSSNAQAGKNIKPQGIKIDDGGVISSSGNKTVETLLNENKLSGMGNWSNGITLGDFAKFSHSYTVGEVSQYQEEDSSDDEIMPEHVGSAIEETVTTQTDSEGTTPKSVSIGLERNESVATVGLNLSDTAKIYVPYNFILNPSITELGDGNGGSKVFFAGETVVVGARIDLKSKANAITTDLNPETGEYESYVTKAKNVKTRLVVYPRRGDGEPDSGGVVSGGVNVNICNSYFGYSDSECSHSNIEDVKGQNDDDILYPSSEGFPINSPKIVVEDLPAGSELCVALAVFPATSGADNNWNDLNYDNTWRVSASKCYTVAKKPSLQVWGGSIYSDANIDVPLSSKKHLANYVNYDASRTEDESYIFGSWGELGLIANKSAKGFASGASLGYAGNNDGVTLPKPDANDGNSGEPGGYYNSSNSDAGVLCVMSPLTIANENCNTGTVGNLGADTAVGGINKDRNALKNLAEALGIGGTNAVSGVLSTFQEENYYEAAGELTIGQSEDITVPSDRTILVHSKENIQINKNIHYENIDYQSLLQTPKLIIYSDKTISIDCTVTRIDAVLLADTVDTCPTQDNNWNPRQNSNQLFIYGAVIANTLKANRTYGAAPGNNSIVPAEIIDFDPTLYLWQGANDADDDPVNQEDNDNNKSFNLDTVYSHEMVPRY